MSEGGDAARPAGAGARLTIESTDPMSVGSGIKALFADDGDATFGPWFDVAYPIVLRRGGLSWVGRDAAGVVRSHIAQVPQWFDVAGREVRGGNMMNMLVARDHRSLFHALALVKRMIADSRAAGTVDFLYGTPNEGFAILLERTPFKPVGTVQRFTLPTGDARPVLGTALSALAMLRRLLARGLRAVVVPAGAYDCGPAVALDGTLGSLRPLRDESLFRFRIPGYPSADDCWVELRDRSGTLSAAALLRGDRATRTATIISLHWRRGAELGPALRALGWQARRLGNFRLQMFVLESSPLASSLRRAGFIARADARRLFAVGLTQIGEECVAALGQGDLAGVDCDQ